jgi:hypothetical protein
VGRKVGSIWNRVAELLPHQPASLRRELSPIPAQLATCRQ